MNITEAKAIINSTAYKSVLTDDEEFMLLEALKFMIDETKDSRWMVDLGGYHYEKKNYDLALKYYEMADECGDKWAAEGLGYIWYYGRTGEKDYDKAFKYYTKAMNNGNLKSMVKVADMYKNGYGIEKDMDEYRRLINAAYETVKYSNFLGDPLPEVFTRLAKIKTDEGDKGTAISLYRSAKEFLAERIEFNPFFGDLNIMKWLEEDLYKLTELDRSTVDLYDMYVLADEPVKMSFDFMGETYTVESVKDDNGMSIKFGDKWFRDIDDFFAKAVIGDNRVPTLFSGFYNYAVSE